MQRSTHVLVGGLLLLALGTMLALHSPTRASRAAPQGGGTTYLGLILNDYIPEQGPQPTATATATQGPTATATSTPSATPTSPSNPVPPTDWLGRLNYYRALGGLAAVTENASWSAGGVLHSRYMVKNNYIGHSEDPSNPWYTPEGLAAAQNGNAMVHSSVNTPDYVAIDSWLLGPFHQVGLLDPKLQSSGFGSYREADGGWQMGATLDVLRGRTGSGGNFPVRWPQGNAAIPRSYTGGEFPDPLTGCAGYSTPVGAPLLLQLGGGSVTPSVTAHSLTQNGTPVEHCLFDETSYTNPDGGSQSLARSILGSRDAIVIMPRSPLTVGATYTVSVTSNGQTHTWDFTVLAQTTRPQPGILEIQ